MHVIAFLAMPTVALLAEEVIRRWRRMAPALAGLLLVAILANIHVLVAIQDDNRLRVASFRKTVLSIPRLALAKEVPRNMKPFALNAGTHH